MPLSRGKTRAQPAARGDIPSALPGPDMSVVPLRACLQVHMVGTRGVGGGGSNTPLPVGVPRLLPRGAAPAFTHTDDKETE